MRFFKRAHAAHLEVRLYDNTVYLGVPDSQMSRSDATSSSTSSSSSSSTPPASLRGSVRFHLDTSRTFDSLRAILVGHLTVNTHSGRQDGKISPQENHETLRHEVDLLYDHSPHFDAGSHNLEFAILLPSSFTPTIECDSGKLRYTLHAEYLDSTGEKRHSKSKDVLIVSTGASAANSTANEEALVDMISYNYAVGPFSARLISDQPTVGSLLYLHLHLPSPLVGVTLYQVSVTANQKISINSDTYGKGQNTTERHLLRLFNLPNGRGFSDIPPLFTDVQDIAPWKAGDEVTLEHMVRLPSHEVFSPSTPRHLRKRPSSDPLSLTISHSINLKIRYGTIKGDVKELQISRDFTLLSCKCVADTVVAPAYEVKDPRPAKDIGSLWNINRNTGASVSQYGYTLPGHGCACLREGSAEQVSSMFKERYAAPPDSQIVEKLLQ